MTSKNSFYRPEIDGLRTIAVLSVIVYHAEFTFQGGTFLPGGFLGVDVFFVISGFLITSLIIKEVTETTKFSFVRFYERRLRRLLPTLLLVILASCFLAYKYLFATQMVDFVKSSAASISFVANIYWHITLQEYGAEAGAIKPFLHTWSLAVEEQFYLLFPVFFIFLFEKSIKKAIIGVTIIIFISLLSAQWTSEHFRSFSFFQLPTRLWELLSGSLLALLNHKGVLSRGITAKPGLTNCVSLLSIAVLITSIFIVILEDNHPGLVTTIPVVSCMAYIALANQEQWITRILSSRIFVGIGLISYSLYLWHYPIFAFARISGNFFYTSTGKLMLIGVTFFASVASYFTVEKFFRDPKRISSRRFTQFSLTTIAVLALVFSYLIHRDSDERRFGYLVELYGEAQFDNNRLREESDSLIKAPPANARFKAGSDKTKVLIVGNSHGKDFYNVFVQNIDLFSKYEFEYIAIGAIAHDSQFDRKIKSNPWFIEADVVVLSTRFMPRNEKFLESLYRLGVFIDNVKRFDKTMVILSNTVEFNPINDKPVYDWYVRSNTFFVQDELRALFYLQRNTDIDEHINRQVKKLAAKKEVIYLDKSEFLCNEKAKTCDGLTPDGHKAFYDYGHYTLKGAKYFGQKIAQQDWFDLSDPD